jgi:hypothetical protein
LLYLRNALINWTHASFSWFARPSVRFLMLFCMCTGFLMSRSPIQALYKMSSAKLGTLMTLPVSGKWLDRIRPGHRLSCSRLSVFSLSSSRGMRLNISVRPWSHYFTLFQIYYAEIIVTFDAIDFQVLRTSIIEELLEWKSSGSGLENRY